MKFELKHFIQEKISGGRVGKLAPSALYHPYRDWRLLLVALLLVLIASSSAAVYVFLAIKSGDLFGNTSVKPRVGETRDKANLESVVKELEARSEGKSRAIENAAQIVDPS